MLLRDIFGQEVKVGDQVAVGMSFMRSSVLRVGEVVNIKEKPMTRYRPEHRQEFKYSITVRWTHNGSGDRSSYGEVGQSTILHESSHTFAKLLVLPKGFAEQFPHDVTRADVQA